MPWALFKDGEQISGPHTLYRHARQIAITMKLFKICSTGFGLSAPVLAEGIEIREVKGGDADD